MSEIEIKGLTKYFGKVSAVNNLNLTIKDGEFITLLGPSGCGKTTTLRCISGLETPQKGTISIDKTTIFSSSEGINVAPGQRKLGLVFQNYALWPHMSVGRNISFGLRKEKLKKDILQSKVKRILKVVGLDGYDKRYPYELSGGQQQRVAVARMIVTEPKIFLFDEPLSNLDAKLRMKLRSEIKRLHTDLKATSVYVTHDQVEAMALSDRIVVMKNGKIQQVGSPYDIYHFPSNLFVADFMGNPQTNIFKGIANYKTGKLFITMPELPNLTAEVKEAEINGKTTLKNGAKVFVNVRPEDIEINTDTANMDLPFLIYTIQPLGSEVLLHLKPTSNDIDIVVKSPEDKCLNLKMDMNVNLVFRRGNIYNSETENLEASFGF